MKQRVWLQGLFALILFLSSSTLAVHGAPAGPVASTPNVGIGRGPGVQVQFEGPINSLVPGAWVVGSTTVQVLDSTILTPKDIQPRVGDHARVRAVTLADGGLRALYVTVTQSERYEPPLIEFAGLLESAAAGSWSIGGQAVSVNAETVITGQAQIGCLAQVQAWRLIDDTLLAASIRLTPANPEAVAVQFEGEIHEYPTQEPYTGDWLIGDVRVTVSAAEAIDGIPIKGLRAEVEALSYAGGPVQAQRIRVIPSSEEVLDLAGVIRQLPAGAPYGLWTIGRVPDGAPVTVTVTASALLDDSRAAAAVGQWASIRARREPDGALTALHIRIEPLRDVPRAIECTGPILALPADGELGAWRVGLLTVTVGAETKVQGVPTVGEGALAHVKGTLQGDGSVLAQEITVTYPFGTPAFIKGRIEVLPNAAAGFWRLSGADGAGSVGVWVTPFSRVSGAPPATGALATVHGIWFRGPDRDAGANHVLAFTIEVETPPPATDSIDGAPAAHLWPPSDSGVQSPL